MLILRKGWFILEINFYADSDTGKVRAVNQDGYIICGLGNNATICVVCDGMGGAKSGNVASRCAAETFVEKIREYTASSVSDDGMMLLNGEDACAFLADAVADANAAVLEKSKSSAEFEGMGTTLVAALFCDDTAYVANVGDSRMYLISDGEINQVTHDHSYVQHLVDAGQISPEDARVHPFRNRITKAVGIHPDIEPDIFTVDLSNLDLCYLLLCTDGLCGQLEDCEMLKIISDDPDSDDTESELSRKTEKLIKASNDAGGPDNITVILVKCTQPTDNRH